MVPWTTSQTAGFVQLTGVSTLRVIYSIYIVHAGDAVKNEIN